MNLRSRILELLRKAGEEYMSGEEIAKRLGVSRTAVWKHIKELREAGYGIKSRSRSGYALEETPDCLLPGEIENGLRTRFIAKDIVFFEEIDSTNQVAKQLAQKGAAAARTLGAFILLACGKGHLVFGDPAPAHPAAGSAEVYASCRRRCGDGDEAF